MVAFVERGDWDKETHEHVKKVIEKDYKETVPMLIEEFERIIDEHEKAGKEYFDPGTMAIVSSEIPTTTGETIWAYYRFAGEFIKTPEGGIPAIEIYVGPTKDTKPEWKWWARYIGPHAIENFHRHFQIYDFPEGEKPEDDPMDIKKNPMGGLPYDLPDGTGCFYDPANGGGVTVYEHEELVKYMERLRKIVESEKIIEAKWRKLYEYGEKERMQGKLSKEDEVICKKLGEEVTDMDHRNAALLFDGEINNPFAEYFDTKEFFLHHRLKHVEEWPDTSDRSVPYWPAWLTEDEYMNNIYGEYNPKLQGYIDRLKKENKEVQEVKK